MTTYSSAKKTVQNIAQQVAYAADQLQLHGFDGYYNVMVGAYVSDVYKTLSYPSFANATNRAKTPLCSIEQAVMYTTLYGESHFDHFSTVITQIMGHHVRKDAVSKTITVIDYGCGQAIASLALLSYLEQHVNCQGFTIHFHLVEPSQTSITKKQFTEVGDMNEYKKALEIMSRNKNNIEASLAFHNNVEKMKKEFVGKLKLDLYLNAKSYPQKIILRNMKVDNKYEKFSFGSIENIGIICFEFQDYYNKPSLGVKFLGKFRHSEFASEHKSRINRLLNENIKNKQFESSNWWLAKDKFEPFDWRSSSKPWQMMKDDTMATKILDEVLEIYKVLIENGYEII